ncbi:MAG: hypothetical protein WD467_03155 [Candidatus Saccharimonadales bacterium]
MQAKESLHNQPLPPEREPGCIICEEVLDQTDGLICRRAGWQILVSRDQGYLGRCLVMPTRHIDSEADLSEAEVLAFHYLKVDLESAVLQVFGARMCNWTELGNDAFQAKEPKPHLHYHMRPRYERSVEFAGHEFADPQFGHMYDLNQRWNVDTDPQAKGFKDLVAAALRSQLDT